MVNYIKQNNSNALYTLDLGQPEINLKVGIE